MKIHGIAYIIIGILVTSVSYFVDKDKLVLFMVVGGVMVAIGASKVVFGIVFGPKKERGIKRYAPAHTKNFNKANAGFCSYCGGQINPNAMYCQFCGARIR